MAEPETVSMLSANFGADPNAYCIVQFDGESVSVFAV